MDTVKQTLKGGYTHVGLFVGVIFAIISLTPSLLPRSWVMQGVLTGLALVFGYGVGNVLGAIYRYFELPEPSTKHKFIFKKISIVVGGVVLLYFLSSIVRWGNTIRDLMDIERITSAYSVLLFLLAIFVAYLVIIISRGLRGVVRLVIRQTHKIMPPKFAKFAGLTLGTLLIVFLFNGVLMNTVMSGVNSAFSTRDGTTDEGVVQPTASEKSGSPESLVAWDTLGRQGRKFAALGPTVDQINEFSGGGAKEPIRSYIGLKSADTIEKRADLALEELKRTGAFDRRVLIVATTTGTGWLDPSAVDTLEYIHNGDSAIVGLQYSYLPSWISLFVDQQITKDTAQATLNAVHDYWSELDESSRPELYLFGLSLGSYGSQDSANNLRLINDPIDGALWVGSPFVSETWSRLTDERDEGSPAWRPMVDEGRVVRFTGEQNELNLPIAEWGDTKLVYLQHATDPIVFFSPGLLFSSPDWLKDGERGPDLTPDMDWYPGVTFWQVAADLPMAGAVPGGHGHTYSKASYIDTWAAVTEPEGWSDEKANQLKAFVEK